MRWRAAFVAALACLALTGGRGAEAAAAGAPTCAPAQNLGVSRVVEIDTSTGPLYGSITRFAKQESFLQPKEVVLTFDDGPAPGTTRSILDTLDQFCTKATFFEVGRMALAYPDLTKAVLGRGHTVGTHSWSHPLALSRLKPDAARDEIDRGFAAVALAAGEPIAPFFRFPGLGDTGALLSHLQEEGIATFTVDVVSDDSFIGDTARLIKTTMQRVDAHHGGIILFHDIKSQTARALPQILTALKAGGYSVVQLRAKHGIMPVERYAAELTPMLAKAELIRANTGLFTPPRGDGEDLSEAPVTEVTPAPKSFGVAAKPPAPAAGTPVLRRATGDNIGAWATSVQRPVARPQQP